MSPKSFPLRRAAAAVGVLAVVPVAWYGFASSGTAGVVSTVYVILIFATLYAGTAPIDGPDHRDGTSV